MSLLRRLTTSFVPFYGVMAPSRPNRREPGRTNMSSERSELSEPIKVLSQYWPSSLKSSARRSSLPLSRSYDGHIHESSRTESKRPQVAESGPASTVSSRLDSRYTRAGVRPLDRRIPPFVALNMNRRGPNPDSTSRPLGRVRGLPLIIRISAPHSATTRARTRPAAGDPE
jgi:hypothetical protein